MRWYILSLSLFLFHTVSSQNIIIDSLNTELKKTTTNSTKISLLKDLSVQYSGFDKKKAFKIAKSALQVAYTNKLHKQLTQIMNLLGTLYQSEGSYDSAMYFYNKAYSISDSINSINDEVVSLAKIGLAIYRIGNITQADSLFKKAFLQESTLDKETLNVLHSHYAVFLAKNAKFQEADSFFRSNLKLATELGQSYQFSNIYSSLGATKAALGDYKSAADYYIKGLKEADRYNNLHSKVKIYTNLGNLNYRQRNLKKALENYQFGLQLAQQLNLKRDISNLLSNTGLIYDQMVEYDKAMEHYNKALKIDYELNNLLGVAKNNNFIGIIHLRSYEFMKALPFIKKSIELFHSLNHKALEANSYNHLGYIYLELNKTDKAIQAFNQALELEKSIGSFNARHDIYHNLTAAYAKAGDYDRFLKYFELYDNYKDSIYDDQSTKQIKEVQEKYDNEKLNNQLIIQNIELRNSKLIRNYVIAFALVIFIALLILYISRKKIKKQQTVLAERNEIIQNHKKFILHGRKNQFETFLFLLDGGNLPLIKDKLQNSIKIFRNLEKIIYDDSELGASFPALLKEIAKGYKSSNPHKEVEFDYTQIHRADIDFRTIMIIAPVAGEFILNAIKHATPPQNESIKIGIGLRELEQGLYELTIHDNGNNLQNAYEGYGSYLINEELKKVSATWHKPATVEESHRIIFSNYSPDHQ